jgi:hypothetical protein
MPLPTRPLNDLIEGGYITPDQAEDIHKLCEALSERFNRGEITLMQAYMTLVMTAKEAAHAYTERQSQEAKQPAN